MSLIAQTLAKIDKAGQIGGINQKLIKRLYNFDRILKVKIPFQGEKLVGWRSQHNNLAGPYKGGLRFSTQVSKDEVGALSIWMTLKNALLDIPFGGGKGGINFDPNDYSIEEQRMLLDYFIGRIDEYIGPQVDILAPDVNTNSETMTWLVESYRQLHSEDEDYQAVTTGKKVEEGGIRGRDEATALGAFYVLEAVIKSKKQDWNSITVAIQGFGNAALEYAKEIEKKGGKIVAVSDSKGAVYNPNGFKINKLIDIKNKTGQVDKYPDAKQIPSEQIFQLPVDYLSLAALEDAITKNNARKVKAKAIIEIANGGINPNAEQILARKRIIHWPDILVNAGGVYVSYLEWLQNTSSAHFSLKQVKMKLKKRLTRQTKKLIKLNKENRGVPTKTLAYLIALKNLEKRL